MMDLGVIQPATSPYNAPVVLVRKKDGSTCFCVDFRQLNNVTGFDAEPTPDAQGIFSKTSKARYFSKFDFAKGFWQIKLDSEDRKKTAFSTSTGLFQFTRMPFGLKNATAAFLLE